MKKLNLRMSWIQVLKPEAKVYSQIYPIPKYISFSPTT